MPFNGSGTFTIVNTFVPNTTILSAAVNQNFTDIATGLSDCLTRDGQAGMTAAFKAISGSLGAPSITFSSDATSGLYLPATGIVALVAHSLGLQVNTAIFQAQTATASAGGSNYAVGDTITLTGGSAAAQAVLTVATLSGSAVATATVTYPGIYTTKPSNPVAQGSTSGSGSNATFNLTWNDPGASDYRLAILDQASSLIWTKLGASSFVAGLMAKATAYDFIRSVVTIGTGLTLSNTTSPPTLIAPAVPYQAGFKNLSIKVATNTTVAVAADAVIVFDGANYLNVAPSSTINLGTNGGVNALDSGTIATSTWYAIWVIAKPDGTTACLASTSGTSPTMPTDYTFKARIGWVRTISGSATLYGTWQLGRRAQYVVGLAQTTVPPVIASGSAGTFDNVSPTLTTASVSTRVPTTASEIFILPSIQYTGAAVSNILVAPNTGYGGTNRGPTGSAGVIWPVWVFSAAQAIQSTSMLLESTSDIAWASSSAGGGISCLGWTDNI